MAVLKSARRHARETAVPLSPVLGPLFAAVEGDVDRRAISEIVNLDAQMTVEVLRIANTARYARSGSLCVSVDQALGRLGTARLVEIVNNLAGAVLRKPSLPGYGLQNQALWKMTVATAFCCREIGRQVGLSQGQCYTVGLLVDVGKLALAESLLGHTPGEGPFHLQEQKLLGCDHAQVGAEIARRNGLPDVLVASIRHHHDPTGCDDLMVHAAHVAAMVAAQVLPEGIEGLSYTLHAESLDRLGLVEEDLLQVFEAGADGLVEAEAWCHPRS